MTASVELGIPCDKADVTWARRGVRFLGKSGHDADCPTSLTRSSHGGLAYSITSSARARIDGGTMTPSAFAVLRLMTNSKMVGCMTGRSAGLAPLRILPA